MCQPETGLHPEEKSTSTKNRRLHIQAIIMQKHSFCTPW